MERGSIKVVFIYVVIAISVLITFYVTLPKETVKIYLLPFIALAAVMGTGLVYWAINSTPEKIKRKIKKITQLVTHESAEVLKDLYLEIYNLYMRLSDKHKAKYYPHVVRIRKHLESHMQAEKTLQTLLHETEGKTLPQLKSIYEQIYAHFQKLPHKVQGKYYAKIVHLRQQLENGK
ncbi:MAG: hypothetical protein ABIH82_00715 [Candidatus Woesearchaeota archaeon]